MTANSSHAERVSASKTGFRFFADIEGLRAVAVICVLLFHAGVPWVQGGFLGVDIFFVISGFLITGILLSEAQNSGRVDLGRFYARRARRILPAASLVLIATAFLTFLALPVNRWGEIGGDLIASAVYVINWRLAARAVDYFAQGAAESPVQHYWSLAVEEQFYLLWPVLIAVLLVLVRSRAVDKRRTLAVGIAVLGIPSLAWGVYLASADPARAFFVTTTRVWELALGAGLAISIHLLERVPEKIAAVLTSVGFSAIAISVLTVPGSATPRYFVGLATLGTAAVIAGGRGAPGHIITLKLGGPPARWVGARSYALYLWHWPLVVAAEAQFEVFPVWMGLLVVAISFVPAMISYRFVEAPIRAMSSFGLPKRGLALAAGCALLGVVAGLAITLSIPVEDTPPVAAQQVEEGITIDQVPATVPDDLVPSLAAVASDLPFMVEEGCHLTVEAIEPIACVHGDPTGDSVVMVGDSHAAQWAPTIRILGDERGWNLSLMSKSGCPYLDAEYWDEDRQATYVECSQWNDLITERLLLTRPSLVITTSNLLISPIDDGLKVDPGQGRLLTEKGLERRLTTLTDSGIDVVVIRDTPRPAGDVPDCLARTGDVRGCSVTRDRGLGSELQQRAVDRVDGARLVDMTDYFCTDEICPSIVGDLLVWRDHSHITTKYAESLSAALGRQLDLDK